ncbi:heme NO-binding domain-containing protein [Puniceibacterium confluentis]|uniref:heme NO-binding domain-containing protein n=1 Tax=Puniceibacterium confluentis TaxID=1958944 RepID=UPI0011B48832|nr:heme NO-binding domain-containing protein [Puniceibacterium confluentis]
MHGLINNTLQCFLQDTYGGETWAEIARRADIDPPEFEAMLHYEPEQTDQILDSAALHLCKPREAILEDVGTYLVSHPNTEALRRLLRFGGVTFAEFLHSMDDLPDRARLAVPDLDLPGLELTEYAKDRFALRCTGPVPGFGLVLVGVLRAMADDYGALVILEYEGWNLGCERIVITLIETEFAEGRQFDLYGTPVDHRRAAS